MNGPGRAIESSIRRLIAACAAACALLLVVGAGQAMAATFTVNTTDDADDLSCTVIHCSLREAINAANGLAGADSIDFSIAGAAPHTIQPASALPGLFDVTTVDGGSTPDCAGTPAIEIDGTLAGPAYGLQADSSTIRGLIVNRFDEPNSSFAGVALNNGSTLECSYIGTDDTGNAARANRFGVQIASNGNTVGGASPSRRNVISGNDESGVYVIFGTGNVVAGNYIGTDVDGDSDLGNGWSGVLDSNGNGNVIGGTLSGAGNVISGNYYAGIETGSSANGTTIEGNLIGTDATGTAAIGNLYGLELEGSNLVIGGTSAGAGNTISGNTIGLILGTNGATAQGNRIGTDSAGASEIGNSLYGVLADGNLSNNLIGGSSAAARNVISGNGTGIQFQSISGSGNRIEGNYIGTDAAGTGSLGNDFDGVRFCAVGGTTLGGTAAGVGNRITHNGSQGVLGDDACSPGPIVQRYPVLGNEIYSNGALGIDLRPGAGVTPNDAGDADTGPNDLQNFPVLTNAESSGGTTVIDGSFSSEPNMVYRLEFFASDACDPSGNGEGERFLGAANFSTGVTGSINFSHGLPVSVATGDVVTATATNPAGGTSEFSNCETVTRPSFTVNTTNDNDDGTCDTAHCSLREAINRSNSEPGADAIDFNITGAGPIPSIQPSSQLPSITDPVTIDGGSAPDCGGTPKIRIDGAAAGSAYGLQVDVGPTTIRGLIINRFAANGKAGVWLRGNGGNKVECSYIGTDNAGTNDRPNYHGIVLSSSNNLIGGSSSERRNIISGNDFTGVQLRDIFPNFATGNVVAGNYIGTDVTGTTDLGNTIGVDEVFTSANTIGGTTAGARNVISGNAAGVGVHGSSNLVVGNYIGTNATGTAEVGNTYGVIMQFGPNNRLGGSTPEERNVISGNTFAVDMIFAEDSVVQGNYIGTDASGNAALTGTQLGIFLRASGGGDTTDNVIGGSAPGEGNVISNAVVGVLLEAADAGSDVSGNSIKGNLIGTKADGVSDLGNSGPGIELRGQSHDNQIGGAGAAGNTVAFNDGAGVALTGFDNGVIECCPEKNEISGNSIYSNGALGIDLETPAAFGSPGVTPNDSGDTDTGANELQNFPALTRALRAAGGTVTIDGSLNSLPSTTYRVEFFANDACDPSDHGEGQRPIAAQSVTTDGSGNVSFTATVAPPVVGTEVTATATDPDGNTSEFSECRQLEDTGQIVVVKDAVPDDAQNFNFTAGGGLSPTSFQLDDDSNPTLPTTRTFSDVEPGTGYTLSESIPAGWYQAAATCDDGSPVSNINVGSGETVTCTFTNAHLYPRPGGGTPMRVPLVPSYGPCTTPNATHVGPIDNPSCTPPQQSSGLLTVGNTGQGTGFVRFDAVLGNPMTPADEADMNVQGSIGDVRCTGGSIPGCASAGSDYSGELILSLDLRQTDRANGGTGNESATAQDYNLGTTFSCTPTGGTQGSNCSFTSSFDALLPGLAKEGKRAVMSVNGTTVEDPGTDGAVGTGCPLNCGTGDETVFADQGVFTP